MKKIVALILVLLSLLLLYGCEKPIASDYVRGYKAKIDNDIPYVYTQGAKTVDGHHLTYGYYEKERPYREFVNEYGNKIIRESEYEGQNYYYTVFFTDDNNIYYVFLTKTENGDFVLKKGEVNWIKADSYSACYSAGEVLYTVCDKMYLLLEQDLPENLLGGKLPYRVDPHYIPGLSSFKSTLNAWEDYETVLVYYSLDRGMDKVKDNATSFYRILFSNSFDYTNEQGHEMCGALYLYEITVFKDGTGILRFAHIDENAPYKDIPPNQDETVSLTKDETDSFLKIIEERDFYSLPSIHPEESIGFDGNTTYIFGDNGEQAHVIKHWGASERYDIYHIRKAVEELTKSKIDVKYGGVFIDYGYNNQ